MDVPLRALDPCSGSSPFSALFPPRFILDDSALYLSDKCEVETLDLRRGGQPGPPATPSTQCPPHRVAVLKGTHTCPCTSPAAPSGGGSGCVGAAVGMSSLPQITSASWMLTSWSS